MTYYRFRVAGQPGARRAIYQPSLTPLCHGAGERVAEKVAPVFSHAAPPAAPIPTNPGERAPVATCPAPGYTRTQDRDPIRFANETDLLPPAAPAGKMARLFRGDRRNRQPCRPPLSLATTNSERRSEAITRLPARRSLKVSDYFRESLVLR